MKIARRRTALPILRPVKSTSVIGLASSSFMYLAVTAEVAYCPLSSRRIIARQENAESDRLSFTNMMHYVKDDDKSVHRDEKHYISGHMLAWITKLSMI